MKIILFVISMLCCVQSMLAQTLETIKQSKDYVYGEGRGTTRDEADNQALRNLVSKISISISSSSSAEEQQSVKGGELSELSSFHSSSNMFSQVSLTNTEVIVVSDEPDAYVVRWIKRSELEKIQREREARVVDLVETGKTAESRLQIDDALRCYYQALLLSRLTKGVRIEFAGKEGMAQSLLPVKIKSMLLALQAEVAGGEQSGNRYNTRLRFTYNGNPVSSVTFSYNDGQGIVGPVKAKDGIGEAELLSIPATGKLHITYETRFRSELDPLDSDLAMIYSGGGKLPMFTEAGVDIPIKVKGNQVRAGKADKSVASTASASVAPEETRSKTPITLRPAQNGSQLLATVKKVEEAIRANNSMLARDCFTAEGFSLFHKLMTECGHVSLVGQSDYEFLEANGFLVGRYTRIKMKYRGGKSFTEQLVYRFDPQTGKIKSVAFALTKIGENDIMNAAAQWPTVSRWAVLSFMEDYQTAFALKRDDYISSIFSDDAVIITGTVLKKMDSGDQMFDRDKMINFGKGNKDVKYSRLTKSEYLERLRKIFKEREYVNLTFENNVTKIVETPSIFAEGALFGIEIRQRYASSGYSDDGYLTLLFDTRHELPIIYYRMWQPDKTDMIGLQEFIDKIPK